MPLKFILVQDVFINNISGLEILTDIILCGHAPRPNKNVLKIMPIFQVKKFSQMSHHEEPLWLEIIASFHFQKIVVLMINDWNISPNNLTLHSAESC